MNLLLGIGDCVSRAGLPMSSSEAGSICLPASKLLEHFYYSLWIFCAYFSWAVACCQ